MDITWFDKNYISEIDGTIAITTSKSTLENSTQPLIGDLCKISMHMIEYLLHKSVDFDNSRVWALGAMFNFNIF